jgi:hypothetical protein
MIACTKLFVIDDVRLVIFKGALNFINLPCWLRTDLSASVVRNCCTISGLSPFASGHFVVYERDVSRRLMQRSDLFATNRATCVNDGLIVRSPQHQSQERTKRPSPKRLVGTIPRALIPPVHVKCFAAIRYSSTDPNVATVAVILNTVPITADRIDNRGFSGCGFSLFAFSSPFYILSGQIH